MSLSKGPKFSQSELEALNKWTGLRDFGVPHSEYIEAEQAPKALTVEEIEALQQQAHHEAFEQGRQEGFVEGHKQGFEQGLTEGKDAGQKQGYEESQHLVQKKTAEWARLLESLTEPFQRLDETVEQELVELAIAIAKQIIRREIKLDPSQIVGVVKEAVNALPIASQAVTIHLHPEDADLVRTALKLDDGMPQWRLLENPLLTRGGCTVETEMSTVDASVEKRLTAVIATLLGGERQADSGDDS